MVNKTMHIMSPAARKKLEEKQSYKDVMELAKKDKYSYRNTRKRDMPIMSMPKYIKVDGVPHKFVDGELVELKSK